MHIAKMPPLRPTTRILTTFLKASTRRHSTSSVSANELSHFSSLASSWWDPMGPSRVLHLMNPLRHDFIASCLADCPPPPPPSQEGERQGRGLHYLDVGCGGGIFAESMARTIPVDNDTATVSGSGGSSGITTQPQSQPSTLPTHSSKSHTRTPEQTPKWTRTSARAASSTRTARWRILCKRSRKPGRAPPAVTTSSPSSRSSNTSIQTPGLRAAELPNELSAASEARRVADRVDYRADVPFVDREPAYC